MTCSPRIVPPGDVTIYYGSPQGCKVGYFLRLFSHVHLHLSVLCVCVCVLLQRVCVSRGVRVKAAAIFVPELSRQSSPHVPDASYLFSYRYTGRTCERCTQLVFTMLSSLAAPAAEWLGSSQQPLLQPRLDTEQTMCSSLHGPSSITPCLFVPSSMTHLL